MDIRKNQSTGYRCCDNKPLFKIKYDCSPLESDSWLVCSIHSSKYPFNAYILRRKKIEN